MVTVFNCGYCRRLGQKLTSSTYNYLIQYYFLLWISLHAFGKHSLSRMDEVNVGCYHSMHIIDKCTHKWRAADLFYRKYTVLHFRYNYHTASLSIRLDHQRVYEDENTFVSAKKRGRLECKMFNEDWWYKTLRAETVFKLTCMAVEMSRQCDHALTSRTVKSVYSARAVKL